MKRFEPIRVDEEFYNLIKKIKIDRIKNGTDNIPQSDRRLTKAVARILNIETSTYNSLIKSQLEDDRKFKRRIRNGK